MSPDLRKARPDDVSAIASMIVSEHLPAMEIEEWLDGFWVLDDRGRLVGCAGIEQYGDSAVLRSVMTDPSLRGSGEGVRLVQRCLDSAREGGATRCYLFTMTAAAFFKKFGFEACTLEDFDAAARESWQWRGVSEHEPLRIMLTPMRMEF